MDSKHQDTNNTELIANNEELENYFRNTVIPQLFVDGNLILRKFTPPAMKQFQLSSGDLGKHISELTVQIRFPTIIQNILEVIETNKDMEKEIQTMDHSWYQMNILPYVIRKSNQTNGVIITFVDITSRIETLNQYEKLNLEYQNIIFALSHDLKGPIHNIKGLIGLLKEVKENDKEETNSLLDSMGKSIGKLLKTIEDLTESTKKKTGFAETSERVNIQNIVEDVLVGLGDKISRSKAKIHTEFQVSELKFSRKNIRSIVYNLLGNAIKFSEKIGQPEVWIKTQNLGTYILLTVKDNGPGIDKGKQKAIFNPHTRLDQEVEGTGLGLFIVKRMVEDLGGKVEVESVFGEGSIFRVYFKQETIHQKLN
ncbi:sensor histidine kinase [Cyclobacterium plantarum]|uniref:histidine kinase n=1 Tax=Cyclobacterium plantarum TaxID=2716263 RepID=A0ABX0H463_9BACT|nr:ATP-binding protein [Cyclobacterium plantarum]NHE56409.1 GHKL domain-containing protein [Cyclobacterium plantarum]